MPTKKGNSSVLLELRVAQPGGPETPETSAQHGQFCTAQTPPPTYRPRVRTPPRSGQPWPLTSPDSSEQRGRGQAARCTTAAMPQAEESKTPQPGALKKPKDQAGPREGQEDTEQAGDDD